MYRETKKKKFEESRALLVLGLLAVLASIRSQTINLTVGDNTVSLNQTIDITILLMSMYAICMLVAFSSDMVGEGLANISRSLGLALLSISIFVLAVEAIALGFAYYQMRFIGILFLISLAASIWGYFKLRERKKKRKTQKMAPISNKNQAGYMISAIVFVLSIMGVGNYVPVEYMWFLLIPASVSMVSLVVFSNRIQKEKEKEIETPTVTLKN